MRTLAYRLLIICATCYSAAGLGRYPLTNDYVALADVQCLHSGLYTKCIIADSTNWATLSISATVYTGMYVSGTSTGVYYTVTTNVPPTTNANYYYTTNYSIGTVAATLTNWTGTNVLVGTNIVNAAYTVSGPMSAAWLAQYDVTLRAIVPQFIDPWAISTNWQEQVIGAATNVRVVNSTPCEIYDTWITNKYVVSVYRATPPSLTVTSLWDNLHIGADFFYSLGAQPYQQHHSYLFTAQPTQSVQHVLATFACIVTNSYLQTNVNAGVTNIVTYNQLTFGSVGESLVFWPFTNINAAHCFPSLSYTNINYPDRTNHSVYLRVQSGNTNVPTPDLSGVDLTLIGDVCDFTTNSGTGWHVQRETNEVSGVTDGQQVDTKFQRLFAEDPEYYASEEFNDCWFACDEESTNFLQCFFNCAIGGILTRSSFHRTETNGQWNSLIGTRIDVIWSNTVAFYGNPAGMMLSASGMNERYQVLTSLVATCKRSTYGQETPTLTWKADMNTYGETDGSCYDSGYGSDPWFPSLSSFTYPATLTPASSTNILGLDDEYLFGGAYMDGLVSAVAEDHYANGLDTYIASWYGMDLSALVSDLSGIPHVRLAHVPTNVTPPAISREIVYARPQQYYPTYLDPTPPDAYLQYTEVADIAGPIAPVVNVISLKYFSATNWVYVPDVDDIELNTFGLFSSAWWAWEISEAAGECPSDYVVPDAFASVGTRACIEAQMGTNISYLYGSIASHSEYTEIKYDLFSVIYWDVNE